MMQRKSALVAVVTLVTALASYASAESQSLGDGFVDHGVATPVSGQRGIVATTNGQDENVVLVWLNDHRGTYAVLMIDAATGETHEFPLPVPAYENYPDSVFASLLSSDNKLYTHVGGYFFEFDPEKPGFTFVRKTKPGAAMSLTEDDQGVIWAATFRNSNLMSYNPETGQFTDYGYIHEENWRQYPRTIAVDDAGWVYVGIGSAASQIVAFKPETGQTRTILPESQRPKGSADVYRLVNGKVYGDEGWDSNFRYLLYKGQATPLEHPPEVAKKPIIADTQNLFHREFPDGKRIAKLDLIERVLVVEDPQTHERHKVSFDYTSEGNYVIAVAAAPNGTINGGTNHPMRFFSYDPKADQWVRHETVGQMNAVAAEGDQFFIGAYTHGLLLQWTPSKPWVPTEEGNPESNPLWLASISDINRPSDLLALPEVVIMAGTPGYGDTGGGLLFWDRSSDTATLLTHKQILPDLSTATLAPLPGGKKIIAGTTTRPGTGGEIKAEQAQLYIMDINTKKVLWHEPVFAKATNYSALLTAPGGLIYGFIDDKRFFVFDPETHEVIHQQNTAEKFGPTNVQQGSRTFVTGPNGKVFVLFGKGIAAVNPRTYEIKMLAESPVEIGPGGDYLDGRIYFASGSHLYSWAVPGR